MPTPLFATQCPAGQSTSLAMAAISASQCDVCRPGFGANSTTGAIGDGGCSICNSGYYSPGYKAGGQNCGACPKPENYTGKMVSRSGAWSPEECVPEFPTDATAARNAMAYDVIPHADDDDVFALQPSIANAADCQAACAADAECQYFAFYKVIAPRNAGDNKCFFRKVAGAALDAPGARIAGPDDAWWDAPDRPVVLFEVRRPPFCKPSANKTLVLGCAHFWWSPPRWRVDEGRRRGCRVLAARARPCLTRARLPRRQTPTGPRQHLRRIPQACVRGGRRARRARAPRGRVARPFQGRARRVRRERRLRRPVI